MDLSHETDIRLDPVAPITTVHLEDELKHAYLGYAMSVIVGRALPDVRDGLKPVQRRILFAMQELGNFSQKPHKKSARIVGDTSGKYHPHGEDTIYDALVRMAQSFSLRCPLIDGQGNFGSVDGDPAAARRYTEARLTPLAEALLKDFDKGTVDFVPNYDNSEKIPVVLPAAFPNLLVNGSSGIAVGMATNIPPHNLGEVLDAVIAYLQDPGLSIEALMQLLPGPDFPTGGVICGTQGILQAYRTGKGRILMRAKAFVEEGEHGKSKIVITELPYQVNKSRLLESIADLVKEKRIEGITEIRDESDREGMRAVLELRRGTMGEVLLRQLFSMTALEQPFSANIVVLDRGRPVQASLTLLLDAFIAHRKVVTMRRARFERDKVQARLQTLEGFRVALLAIEETIALVRDARSPAEAKEALMARAWRLNHPKAQEAAGHLPQHLRNPDFRLNELQAQAILDLRLHRLTHLEMEKIETEASEAEARCRELSRILEDSEYLKKVMREELTLLKRHATPRRSRIEEHLTLSEEDLIPEEMMVVTFSQKGYIKSQPMSEYSAQHRGGRGKLSGSLRTEDFGVGCLVANTHDLLLCFSTRGRAYGLKVHQIPRCTRLSKGRPINNLLPIPENESITNLLALKKGDSHACVVLASASGILKKLSLQELLRSRMNGITALKLKEGDQLVGAAFSSGEQEVLLFSAQGKVVRFPETQIRPMGRMASGVRGIKLAADDRLVSLCLPEGDESLLTVTENGFGKRTDLNCYPQRSRATKGVISMKVNERNGGVIGALSVLPEDEVIFLTDLGHLVRLRVKEINQFNRNTQGVTLMRLEPHEKIVGFQKVCGAWQDA